MSVLDDLLDAIYAAPNLTRGLCVGQHDLFDAVDDPAAVERALGLCAECKVLTECAAWADSQPRRSLYGVIAGHIYREPRPGVRGRPRKQKETA